MGNCIKFIGIKTKDCFYISDNISDTSYFSSIIKNCIFDEKEPKPTYLSSWFELESEPTNIKRKLPDKNINIRWELKEGYLSSELIPKVLYYNPNDETFGNQEISGLYTRKFDIEEGGYQEIEFSINIISEEDNFKIIKSEYSFENSFLDKIRTPQVLLTTKECTINSNDFYKIIRKHIKKNIDNNVAEITNDYDFCLTVSKKIKLSEAKPYIVNFGTKKRPKPITKYNTHTKIECYKIAPASYQTYPVIGSITGDNYQDLEKKIDEYLDEIMDIINKPVVECSCCNGNGVIFEKIN